MDIVSSPAPEQVPLAAIANHPIGQDSAGQLNDKLFSGDGSSIPRPEPRRLSPKETIEGIRVLHPRMKAAIQRIRYAQTMSRYAAEPYCLLVVGPSGVGKSSMIEEFLRDNPRRRRPDGTTIPALAVVIPSQATMGSMASSLLAAMGDPIPDKGNIDARTRRVYTLLRECKVEIIILDEFQHFIDRENEKVLMTVSDWMKNLISETNLPIALVGLDHSRRVLAANEQLKRRFQSQVELQKFCWSTNGRLYFMEFLKNVEAQLPFKEQSKLYSPEIAESLLRASDGLPATVMKIIRQAAHDALESKASKITPTHLRDAYSKVCFQEKNNRVDHFQTIFADPPYGPKFKKPTSGVAPTPAAPPPEMASKAAEQSKAAPAAAKAG